MAFQAMRTRAILALTLCIPATHDLEGRGTHALEGHATHKPMDNFKRDFFPCERHPYPGALPLIDLSTDERLAGAVYAVVEKLFWINDKFISFSGFARPVVASDDPLATLYAQVWYEDQLYRSVAFRQTGFVGVLHMDIDGENALSLGLGRDLIENACAQTRSYPDSVTAVVSGERLEVGFEIRQ